MPLRDFRCASCEETFEVLVRSEEIPRCPHCGATALEQQLSTFAVGARRGQPPDPCATCGRPDGPGT